VLELAPNHKRGLALANPVLNASGILGFAAREAYRGLIDFAALGGFVTNALTLTPRAATHPPNAIALPNGILIHTGLPNPGVTRALKRYSGEWARLGPPVIVHLAATSPADTRRSVERLERAESVSGIELGFTDEVTPDDLVQLIRAARGGLPLLARLPLARALDLAEPAARAGADALTLAAPPRLAVEHEGRTVTGRFYGPDNFSRALETIQSVIGKNLGLPVIGAGGLYSVDNARAMLDAGAIAVQVDAALWNTPGLLGQMTEALRQVDL